MSGDEPPRPPDILLAEEHIPPSDDERWPIWAAKVDELLAAHRTVRELRAALPQFSTAVLTNTLSWMDLRGMAVRTREHGRVLWGRPPATSSLPTARPPRCLRCNGPWTRSITGIICILCGRMP